MQQTGFADRKAYWTKNLTYVGILLAIWFIVSYGFGILLVETLNAIRIPGTGFPLGLRRAPARGTGGACPHRDCHLGSPATAGGRLLTGVGAGRAAGTCR